MERQMTIDDPESLFVNHLTTRQWKLHNLLLKNAGRRMGHMEMLQALDGVAPDYYEYTKETKQYPKREKNDLSCKRELQEDIECLKWDKTIQQVYVGGKYNNTILEARIYLKKIRIAGLTMLAFESLGKYKLALDGQQRMVFNKERDHWESCLKVEQEELGKLEKEMSELGKK